MAFKVGSTTVANNSAIVPAAVVVFPSTMAVSTSCSGTPSGSNPYRGSGCYRAVFSPAVSSGTLSLF